MPEALARWPTSSGRRHALDAACNNRSVLRIGVSKMCRCNMSCLTRFGRGYAPLTLPMMKLVCRHIKHL
eukprot:3159916-Pleurochrysis_carterae.AAC.2